MIKIFIKCHNVLPIFKYEDRLQHL